MTVILYSLGRGVRSMKKNIDINQTQLDEDGYNAVAG